MQLPAVNSAESHLLALAVALGAPDVEGWSLLESKYLDGLDKLPQDEITNAKGLIRAGDDPLGGLFCRFRSAVDRRPAGAVYTPAPIIKVMVERAAAACTPTLIVDPGVGSARFLVECGRKFPTAQLLGVEVDPLAAILARGHLAAAGFAHRSKVILEDYRSVKLPPTKGTTLFIGNPPYVRHHLVEPTWKKWLVEQSAKFGLTASTLAGLHVYFFLATLLKAKKKDFGIFLTSSEWLDVNYGSLMRSMLLEGLGGKSITVVEAEAMPFSDAMTTAAVTSFEVQAKPSSILFRRAKTVEDLLKDSPGSRISRKRLETEHRWSYLTRVPKEIPQGFVELGELCRVHRGQVTGNNHVWIAGEHSSFLPPSVLYPTVTKAKELISAGTTLSDASKLRCVIDIPAELDEFSGQDRRNVEKFLRTAQEMGGDQSYTAQNRKAWWSVGLRNPAPILCTYMARRVPAFVHNDAEARHINIAHGIYPREPLTKRIMSALVSYLSRAVNLWDGRTYAGGLVKYEPRELERFAVPGLELLRQGFDASTTHSVV